MILEIFDKEKNRVGMIKAFKSASYVVKYNGIGTFTVKVPNNEDSVKLLQRDNYILLDVDVMGVIKYRGKQTSKSTEITISGYLINHILTYRTFLKTQSFTGTVEEICEQMINNNFINPEDDRRKISFVKVISKTGSGQSKRIQRTGGTIESAIESILSVESKGYSVKPAVAKYDEVSGSETNISYFGFEVLEPTDRTFQNEQGNNPIVFSMQLNNLESLSFDEDGSEYKNVAIVAGAGEGVERVVVEVGDSEATGIDRIELYVDARDLSKTETTETGTVEISDEEYNGILTERGNEYLEDNKVFLDMDGKIIQDGSTVNKYGVDYFLGDFVSVIDDDLGYIVNAQITEMTKTISSGTEKVDFTFGYQKESLRKTLTKKGVI